MIEFIKKNQKHITMAGAISLLILCYFQRKEIAKLRADKNTEASTKSFNLDSTILKTDSSILK
jgi:hypothetical protein